MNSPNTACVSRRRSIHPRGSTDILAQAVIASTNNDTMLVVGDTTIDLYPTDNGSIAPGSNLEWHIGGTATNVARWAAVLDCEVDLMTNHGTDVMGELAAEHLANGPVGTSHVTQVDTTSPLTLYTGAQGDEEWNAWVTGSCYGFTPPDNPAALLADHNWVHLEGVTLPAEVNQTAVLRLAETAAANATHVSFDLNGRENQWDTPDDYRETLEDVLPYCDLIFAGKDDLEVAAVNPTPAGLRTLLPADHSARAFITAGDRETIALQMEDGEIVEQVNVTPPEVTVATPAGAGDAFAGAVLAARCDGITDLHELATIGNTAGAAAVVTVGPYGSDSVATMDQLF